MKALIGFGLGIVVGVCAAWPAGRRYESAAAASAVAAGYVGIARERWKAAIRYVVLAGVVVAMGALIVAVTP